MNYLYLFYKDIQLTNCGLVSPATFQQGLQKVRSTCEIDFLICTFGKSSTCSPPFSSLRAFRGKGGNKKWPMLDIAPFRFLQSPKEEWLPTWGWGTSTLLTSLSPPHVPFPSSPHSMILWPYQDFLVGNLLKSNKEILGSSLWRFGLQLARRSTEDSWSAAWTGGSCCLLICTRCMCLLVCEWQLWVVFADTGVVVCIGVGFDVGNFVAIFVCASLVYVLDIKGLGQKSKFHKWPTSKVIEMMTSGDDDDEDEGLGVEERTGLVEAVIEVCRLGTFCSRALGITCWSPC